MNRSLSEAGFSIVGAMVTLGIIGIAALALMSSMDQFSKTSRKVETKESVIQEAVNKAAIIQVSDYLKVEDVCKNYAIGGFQPGNCSSSTSSSTHPFLYRWYKADPLSDVCLELSICRKVAAGKMIELVLTAHHKVQGKPTRAHIKFRKAK